MDEKIESFVFYSPSKDAICIVQSSLFRFGVGATWWDFDFGDIICIGDFD